MQDEELKKYHTDRKFIDMETVGDPEQNTEQMQESRRYDS